MCVFVCICVLYVMCVVCVCYVCMYMFVMCVWRVCMCVYVGHRGMGDECLCLYANVCVCEMYVHVGVCMWDV